MYKKKLLLSITSLPFICTSLSFTNYNIKQKQDKLAEISLRKSRIDQLPISLNDNKNNKSLYRFLKNSSSVKSFNHEFSYKPFELIGRFDHDNTLLLKSLEQGTYGYKVLTPFYYTQDNSDKINVIIVDRGFTAENQKYNVFDAKGYIKIKGFLKYPHMTKYSLTNDLSLPDRTIESLNLNDINDLLYDQENSEKIPDNSISRKVYLEQYDENNNSIFPRQLNKQNLLELFNASPEVHSYYTKLFSFISFSMIYGNIFFWISL